MFSCADNNGSRNYNRKHEQHYCYTTCMSPDLPDLLDLECEISRSASMNVFIQLLLFVKEDIGSDFYRGAG